MGSESLPRTENPCDAILDLIPEYAFGLTTADENRIVEAGLPTCAEAAARLAEYRQMQSEMRADVPQLEPPAHLAQKLMAATNASPRPRRFSAAWLTAAAAVLALLVTNVYWLGRTTELEQRIDIPLIQPDDTNAFVLTSTSGLRWVRLPGKETSADASAFLMWNAESKIGILYAHGFPELAVGKTYQLWLTRDEVRTGAGTFRVDAEGKGALLFHSEVPIDEFTWAGVTDEPENGSEQPTGTVVVNGSLI
ncbi:MAG: anti-sigma factor [Anaerolineae bacterium]|nr:anti-sigma factor [Anaerolineae bacterium]